MKTADRWRPVAGAIVYAVAVWGVIAAAVWLTRPAPTGGPGVTLSTVVTDVTMRRIDTPGRLWLNGYLGLFFRLDVVGYWNWLALPLLVVFLGGWSRRDRWQKALFAVFALSAALVAAQGYFNPRYAATLLPVTLAFILAFGRDSLAAASRPLRLAFWGSLLFLIFFGFLRSADYRPISLFPGSDDPLPRRLFRQVNALKLKPDEAFLECNAPAFYYYTDRRGLSYNVRFLHRAPGILTKDGVIDVFHDGDKAFKPGAEELAGIFNDLKKKHGVKYILTNSLPPYYRSLRSVIRRGCDLIGSQKSYRLYRLRERFLDPSKNRPVFRLDFSSRAGPLKIRPGDLKRTVPPLAVLRIRGSFDLRLSPRPSGPVLKISPRQRDQNGDLSIILGFRMNRDGFDLKPGADTLAVFDAAVKLSRRSKKAARIFIREKIGSGEIDSTVLPQRGWNRVSTSRSTGQKPRDLVFGIVWTPDRMTDRLEIRDFQVFLLKSSPVSAGSRRPRASPGKD